MYPISWCFDSTRRPVCPSLWDERDECDAADCPFSHAVESQYVQGTCMLPLRLLEDNADLGELAAFLGQQSDVVADAGAAEVEQPQSEEDEEAVRRIYKEMSEFEEEKKSEVRPTHQKPCLYFLETGNCLCRAVCPFAHEAQEEPFVEDVNSRWYPSGKDCECCRGFIYKCERAECRSAGQCTSCQS